MLIGYARVSTTDQNLTLQKDALEKAGCERIYEDELSGTKDNRPGLLKLYLPTYSKITQKRDFLCDSLYYRRGLIIKSVCFL
ncbi:recombinase family protein [Aliarcobacter cryaerophilus]